MTKPTTTATAKTKAIRMPGKERPAASRLVIPRASHDGASPKESMQKQETLRWPAHRQTAEGLDYRFLPSQPVSSVLDHSARRDPGRATPTQHATRCLEHRTSSDCSTYTLQRDTAAR
jgi:hypothetical protein